MTNYQPHKTSDQRITEKESAALKVWDAILYALGFAFVLAVLIAAHFHLTQ